MVGCFEERRDKELLPGYRILDRADGASYCTGSARIYTRFFDEFYYLHSLVSRLINACYAIVYVSYVLKYTYNAAGTLEAVKPYDQLIVYSPQSSANSILMLSLVSRPHRSLFPPPNFCCAFPAPRNKRRARDFVGCGKQAPDVEERMRHNG